MYPLANGDRLILLADTTATTAVRRQLREVMIGAGLATLLVAALLFIGVSRAALRPLNRLTALARGITTGDRGLRLRPQSPDTDLGRAAGAFDAMLDALETSERRARDAAAEACRSDAATRRFLSDAAHELRTPLSGMQAAAEQIANTAAQRAQDPVERGQYHRASLLLADARRAGRLVADMLDLSRIDAGLALQVRRVDLSDIVAAEVDRTAMLAPQLTISRRGTDCAFIDADPVRIAQILSNLFDNARRFSPAEAVITADVQRCDQTVQVTVDDCGPGVPAAERERIFERLVRLDAGRDRDHGGAGLGLAIARALARAHGGDLVCLDCDEGARFRLTLPAASGLSD